MLSLRLLRSQSFARASTTQSFSTIFNTVAPAVVTNDVRLTTGLSLPVRHFATKSALADLKELRARSGAPMVECQKALQASDHDIDAALEWIRKHGAQKAASKLSGRSTTEGMVGLALSSLSPLDNKNSIAKAAALVQVAAETDFASRSDAFVQLVQSCANSIVQQSKYIDSVEQAMDVKVEDETKSETTEKKVTTLKHLIDDAVVSIRENIRLENVYHYPNTHDVENGKAQWVGYVHNRRGDTLVGTAAAIVLLSIENETVDYTQLQDVGKKLAMHVVAARPEYMSRDEVPDNVLQKEREIVQSNIVNPDSKPPEVLQKIIDGKMRKFYESVCLLEQSHMIEEDHPPVSNVLQKYSVKLHKYRYCSI